MTDGVGGGGWNPGPHLPITNITRIMQKASPEDAQIDYDTKEAMEACVSEFISFITNEASDTCRADGRVTVTAVDIIWAMCTLGFEEYIGPLLLYLKKYREDASKRSVMSGDGHVKKEGGGSDGGAQSDPSTQGDLSTQSEFEKASREHLMQSLKDIESQILTRHLKSKSCWNKELDQSNGMRGNVCSCNL